MKDILAAILRGGKLKQMQLSSKDKMKIAEERRTDQLKQEQLSTELSDFKY